MLDPRTPDWMFCREEPQGSLDLTLATPEYREGFLRASAQGRASFKEWIKTHPVPRELRVVRERIEPKARQIMRTRLAKVTASAPAAPAPAAPAPEAPRHVLALAAALKPAPRASKPRDPRLPPAGTKLAREFKGKAIKVTVLADGFSYKGKEWGSLSALAGSITGCSTNGFLFFGLTKKS